MFHLLANEVVPGIANTGVEIPVVRAVLGAGHANTVDADIALLAETAAFVEIFIKSTLRSNDGRAGLGGCAVNFTVAASATGVVDEVEAECADAGLLGI